jgi:predicted ATPase
MNEKLVVKNFSVLGHVEIDINNINILIGPQSSGKSILAKLVYFFKTVHNSIAAIMFNNGGKRRLDEFLRTKFNKIFPQYLIKGKTFEVTYHYGNNYVSVTNKGAKTPRSYKISYSEAILKKFTKLKKDYQKKLLNNGLSNASKWEQMQFEVSDDLVKFMHGFGPAHLSYFIPAGRSFFVNIEKNIFSLLDKSAIIDQMLLEFAPFYNSIKEKHLPSFSAQKANFDAELYRLCTEVLGGEYEFRNSYDILKMTGGIDILLKDSSSGQQAAAPLIISLLALSKFENIYLSIEEPEIHVFPESQWKIVEIIAMVYNILERNSSFFITTHSPYILTSFNNLIQAENTARDVNEKLREGEIDENQKNASMKKLDKIVRKKKRVAFEDVSVYSIKDGKCKDIGNDENMLIDANEIDEVSDITSAQFDQMLDISYGE